MEIKSDESFFTKVCFYVHITYSSLNFSWFAFAGHQYLDIQAGRLLLKSA